MKKQRSKNLAKLKFPADADILAPKAVPAVIQQRKQQGQPAIPSLRSSRLKFGKTTRLGI